MPALIEQSDVEQSQQMRMSSMGGSATAGAQMSGRQAGEWLDVRAGGPDRSPMIKVGTVQLGFEDVFLILIALQSVGVILELIEVFQG